MGVALLAVLVAAAAARAQEHEDGWLLPASWDVAVAEAVSPHSVGARAACGTGRLFGMPELEQRYLGLVAIRGGWLVAASWQILGGEAWRERRLRLEAGRRRGPGLRLVWTRHGIESPGIALVARQELAPRLQAALGDGLELAVQAAPLVLAGDAGPVRRRKWLDLRGQAGSVAWALAVDRRPADAPTARAAVLARCARGVALGVLAEPATGTLGLTTAWARRGLVLRSSHLVHPALGVTHRWLLMLRRTSP
jgi:hypothetical protein